MNLYKVTVQKLATPSELRILVAHAKSPQSAGRLISKRFPGWKATEYCAMPKPLVITVPWEAVVRNV